MIVGSSVKHKGEWQEAADTITLDEQARHRRRMAMVSDGGIAFLLDLPEARLLTEGDAILLDDGRLVAIRPKPEELFAVAGQDAGHLLALAWHIGNRHLPAQFLPGTILIRREPLVREMLVGLGGDVREVEAVFDPQGGAHGGAHHAHDAL